MRRIPAATVGILLLTLAGCSSGASSSSPSPPSGERSLTAQVSLRPTGAASVSVLTAGIPLTRAGRLATQTARAIFPDAGALAPPMVTPESDSGFAATERPVLSTEVAVADAFAIGPEPRLRIAGRAVASLAAGVGIEAFNLWVCPPSVSAVWSTSPPAQLTASDGCRVVTLGAGHVPVLTLTMHPEPIAWVVGMVGFLAALALALLSLNRIRPARRRRLGRSHPVMALGAVAIVGATAIMAIGAQDQATLSGAFGGVSVTHPIWSLGRLAGALSVVLSLGSLASAASGRTRLASVD